MTSKKIEKPNRIKLIKLASQFWLTKDFIGENIFIWGKKI